MKMFDFAKGMGIGIIAGASIGMMMPKRHKKNGKKIVNKALRTVGDFVDNVSESISSHS